MALCIAIVFVYRIFNCILLFGCSLKVRPGPLWKLQSKIWLAFSLELLFVVPLRFALGP